jgi:hypothetical protein
MRNFTGLILLFGLLSLTGNAQNPQGFFLDDWQPKTAVSPEYINTPQPTDPATVTVTINTNDTVTKIPQYVYGNNGVPWARKMNNDSDLMEDITNLQPNVLRWPGGNLSNKYFWDASPGNGPTDIPPSIKIDVLNSGVHTANWAMTLNDYYDMLNKTNSTGCICVNYSYARYGTGPDPVAAAAHYAAEWVRSDNGRTKYWEIGNENMGPWEAGYEIDTTLNQDGQPRIISGDLYGRHSRVFIDSMKVAAAEIGSDIKIGVGVMDKHVTYNDVMENWNKKIMPEIADVADFLIIHSYYTPYNQDSDIPTILNSAAHTKDIRNYALNDLKTYGGKDTLPVALTEWNIFAQGSMQAVSYINGMHATLVLGELIKNKYGEATRWDLMNGWANGDDHGIFVASNEPDMDYGTPHAPFYYMYYFQKYFGDHFINSTVSGSKNIISYASSFSSGQSGVVLVNKGTSTQIVNLKPENLPDVKSYYRFVLTGGTDNGDFSRKVYVNGNGPSGVAGGPDNYETVKAYGKSIYGDIKIETPPLSVTYVLLTSDYIPPATGVKTIKSSSFNIYPNPSNGNITISSPGFEFNKIEVLNLNGQKVIEKTFETPVSRLSQLNINLNSGFYILNLKNGNRKISKKLIIE